MRGHKTRVTCVTFSASDEIVVTGSYGSSIIRWTAANGQQLGNPLEHYGPVRCTSISADGTIIVSSSFHCGPCRWDATNGQLLGESISKEGFGDIISTNNDRTKMVTWSDLDKTMRYWRVGPRGTIHETSALSILADITACAIDMNRGVAALGSWNGAVAVCDIYEQFDSHGSVRKDITHGSFWITRWLR